MFLGLPYPNVVNLSLWTIPYELECYLAIMLLYVVGIVRRPPLLLAVIAIAMVIGTVAALSDWDPYWATNRPLPRSLVVAFLVGVAINLYADRLRLTRLYALLALAGMVLCTLDYRFVYLATVPAVYLCVYLGMMHPPRKGILFTGDYSYGLYLFAFPIQQTYTHLFPAMRVWYLNATFTILFGLLYAAFSWWCIEKPLLARKQHFVRIAEAARDQVRRLIGLGGKGHVVSDGPRIG